MSGLDWLILGLTLALIVGYGTWKTRKNNNLEGYLKGNNSENWATIGLSIMATQASAITFLSTPGQAYESGMGFVQFYFGLPIAMVLISVFFLPIYYRLKVYTAYEYLESRFDVRVRAFTAFLFLISRGLAAGITIYAPAIILSALLGWNLQLTCVLIGGLVIVYTVSGGSRAVSLTQKWQMGVIMGGMFLAFYYVLQSFPEGMGMMDGVQIAGELGKMNIIDTSTDIDNRYTLLSGLTGGLFLSLSYFGTDQSQVQRYLGGKSLKESRLGLMFNGLVKIPMQFFILFIGIMVFVTYQFNEPPIVFNKSATSINTGEYPELVKIENEFKELHSQKKQILSNSDISADFPVNIASPKTKVTDIMARQNELRTAYKEKLTELDPNYEAKDSDYIFLDFVLKYLPHGLIGLLLAVIFSAAMSSTAGELNALASTTTIDFYKKFFQKEKVSDKRELLISKLLTVAWGIIAIAIALIAGLFENLIQLVNVLGSLFYGTILGVFLVAFFIKYVKSNAVLIGGLVAETFILFAHFTKDLDWMPKIEFLYYNIIGSLIVILTALITQLVINKSFKTKT
ncbi:MAG: sodium:solute symporter [Crocinitomicaceae bacterium]|nr:sodium:solute symporter [Crocinitomicaceae bacterium]